MSHGRTVIPVGIFQCHVDVPTGPATPWVNHALLQVHAGKKFEYKRLNGRDSRYQNRDSAAWRLLPGMCLTCIK